VTEVTPVSRGWRVSIYALCAVMALSGPGFLALGVLLDAHVWACVLIAVLLSLFLVPLAFVLASDVRRTARGMRRLNVAGVAGTAEILAVTRSRYDDRDRVALNLAISVPGLEPFEVVHNRDSCPELQVGTTLGAVVDPAGRFFAVV
jgi:hypothetical protein